MVGGLDSICLVVVGLDSLSRGNFGWLERLDLAGWPWRRTGCGVM